VEGTETAWWCEEVCRLEAGVMHCLAAQLHACMHVLLGWTEEAVLVAAVCGGSVCCLSAGSQGLILLRHRSMAAGLSVHACSIQLLLQ
jgi:hypothetical protein